MAVGTLFVFVFDFRTWQRVLLMAATVPIAILANVVRVTATGILACKVSRGAADGFFHDFSGLAVFGCGVVLLFLLGAAVWVLGSRKKR
jgi:exosortase